MAAGCACIGSDVVGVREVIDPERTGLLVPEGDAQALASALERLLRSPDRACALAQAGLVVSTQEGRFVRYRAAMPAIRALASFLTEDCCKGQLSRCLINQETP